MGSSTFQFWELLHGTFGEFVMSCGRGKCDEDLVGVKARVVATQVFGFKYLYRFDGKVRDEVERVVDVSQ